MKTIYFSVIACLFLLFSCEEKSLEPTSKSLGKPGPVVSSTVSTTPIAGGVVIKYRVPAAEDILEVRAVYTLPNGQQREESASFYANQLTLEGFNDTIDTNEHEALLYVVNRAMEKSDPVSVKFNTLTSSLSKAAKTVKIVTGFGGPAFIWENPDRATLSFELLVEDETGTLRPASIQTSPQPFVQYTLRPYEPKPQNFGLIVRDNWGNASDIIRPAEGLITPRVEVLLDKTPMNVLILPAGPGDPKGDSQLNAYGTNNRNLINDNIDDFAHMDANVLPEASFTLDLGVSTTVSRVVLHQRRGLFSGETWYYYSFGNLKTFAVYGSNAATAPSSDWSNWTKIAEFEMIKPSGIVGDKFTTDDKAAADAGNDFDFPQLGAVPYRFLRFQIHTVWNADRYTVTYVHIGELTVYGTAE